MLIKECSGPFSDPVKASGRSLAWESCLWQVKGRNGR